MLALVASKTLSAYDCEFVALAKALGAHVVTDDRDILQHAPRQAMTMERFLSNS